MPGGLRLPAGGAAAGFPPAAAGDADGVPAEDPLSTPIALKVNPAPMPRRRAIMPPLAAAPAAATDPGNGLAAVGGGGPPAPGGRGGLKVKDGEPPLAGAAGLPGARGVGVEPREPEVIYQRGQEVATGHQCRHSRSVACHIPDCGTHGCHLCCQTWWNLHRSST